MAAAGVLDELASFAVFASRSSQRVFCKLEAGVLDSEKIYTFCTTTLNILIT